MAFIYDLTDTWNAGGTTFNAIKMNVTDSASAAASKLVTLQVGGAERFGVRKDGQTYVAGSLGVGTSSPTQLLHVQSTSGAAGSAVARLAVSGTAALEVGQEFFSTPTDSTTSLRSGRIYSKFDGISYADARLSFQSMTSGNTLVDTMHLKGGNVGIGTTSPAQLLEVRNLSGDARVGIRSIDTGIAALMLGDDTNGSASYVSYNNADNALSFGTTSNERMRITSAGLVGIGTTSPSNLLTVASPSTAAAAWFQNTGSTEQSITIGDPSTISNGCGVYGRTTGAFTFLHSGGFFNWKNTAGTEFMRITSAGLVGIGTSSPQSLTAGITSLSISDSGAKTTGDKIGELNFITDDSSFTGTFSDGIGASIHSYSATSTGAAYGLAFTTATTSGSNRAERMRIDSSGNVGIGISAVDTGGYVGLETAKNIRMDMGAVGANPAIYFHHDNFSTSSNNFIAVNRTNERMEFNVAGAGRAYIDSSGNLLVGTTSNTIGGAGMKTAIVSDTIYGVGISCPASGSPQAMRFAYGTTAVGSIVLGASSTTYNTSSDYRLKDIDGPIQNSGAYIDALKPVQGSWKADGSRFIGLLAHEVQEVSETQIATGEKDGEEMQAMDYSAPEIIANLIAEIQSLRARVAQLEGN